MDLCGRTRLRVEVAVVEIEQVVLVPWTAFMVALVT